MRYRWRTNLVKSGVAWLGSVPPHWQVRSVRSLFTLGRGRVISQTEIADQLGEYPVYSSQTEADGVLGYIRTFDFAGSYLTWTTDGANAGRVFSRTGRFNCTNVCGTMRPKQPCNLDFLRYCLNLATPEQVRHDINPKLMNNVMAQIRVPFPPKSEQDAIASFLQHEITKIDSLVAKQTYLLRCLDEQHHALIASLVTVGSNASAPMQATGVQAFPFIPTDWCIKPLSALIRKGSSITYGIVQAGPDVPNGIPYIRTSDMNGTELPKEGYLRTAPDIAKSYARSRVEADDLVIAIRATVGKTLIVPPWLNGANLTQGTARIAPGTLITSEYLCYVLNSIPAMQAFDAISKGATFKEITLEMLRKFRVPLPPLQAQMSILELLREHRRSYESVRDCANTMIARLSERRAALIIAAVTGQIDVASSDAVERAA